MISGAHGVTIWFCPAFFCVFLDCKVEKSTFYGSARPGFRTLTLHYLECMHGILLILFGNALAWAPFEPCGRGFPLQFSPFALLPEVVYAGHIGRAKGKNIWDVGGDSSCRNL